MAPLLRTAFCFLILGHLGLPICGQKLLLETASSCNYSTIWLDMVFVIDASAAMGENHLETAWNYTAVTLGHLTVEYGNYTVSNFTSRLGIVTYGNNSTLYRSLGTVNNDDIKNIKKLPYNGEEETNLADGIGTAMGEFNGPNHRPNARRVIVILAASYRSTGVVSPLHVAENFKESGGILIVYHVAKLGSHTEMLKEIASQGYYLNSGSQMDLANALCDANVFCPHNSDSYMNNARGSPVSSCYKIVNTPQGFSRAVNYCSQFYSGIVATDESANKTTFLTSLIQNTSFYIGLQWNKDEWQWLDGSQLGDYQPWEIGQSPVGTNNTCVMMTIAKKWMATDCRNGYYFNCQNPPCSCDNYCP